MSLLRLGSTYSKTMKLDGVREARMSLHCLLEPMADWWLHWEWHIIQTWEWLNWEWLTIDTWEWLYGYMGVAQLEVAHY